MIVPYRFYGNQKVNTLYAKKDIHGQVSSISFVKWNYNDLISFFAKSLLSEPNLAEDSVRRAAQSFTFLGILYTQAVSNFSANWLWYYAIFSSKSISKYCGGESG